MPNDILWAGDHIDVIADEWNGTVNVKFIRSNGKRVTTSLTQGFMPISAPFISNCAPNNPVIDPITVIRSDNTPANMGFTFVILKQAHYSIKPEFQNQPCPLVALQPITLMPAIDPPNDPPGSITRKHKFDLDGGNEIHVTIVLSETIGGGPKTGNGNTDGLQKLDKRVTALEKTISTLQRQIVKKPASNGTKTLPGSKSAVKAASTNGNNNKAKSTTSKATGTTATRSTGKSPSRK